MAAIDPANRCLSQSERVIDLFVAPTETFRDILRNSSWWLPYVLLALSSLCVSLSIEHRVGWDQVVETQIEENPVQGSQFSTMEPAERVIRLHAMAVGYRYTSYASPAVVLLIGVVAALILWGSFTFGLGSRTTFSQMLCLWMYASLPRLFTAFITVVTLWFTGSPESFDLRQPVGTNAGYYLTSAPAWLRTFLSFFDAIGLWSLALLIIGSAIVAHVKKWHAALLILGWWTILLIASVGISAAFS